jgi:hypothetical protein
LARTTGTQGNEAEFGVDPIEELFNFRIDH